MPGTGSPDFESALIALGQLIGLLDASNAPVFAWFGDPAGESLKAIPANRDKIGALFAALTGSATPSSTFATGSTWQPLADGNVEAGFVWTDSPAPLRVGFGATSGGVAVLARLFSESAAFSATSELGKVLVNLPGSSLPSFLSSASAEADVLTPGLTLNFADSQTPANKRAFAFTTPQSAEWDAVRIALFLLESWVRKAAAGLGVSDIRTRIVNHLFPLLGDPANGNTIAASPLVGQTLGAPANFLSWAQSVITTAAGNQNALNFLWHIRALLTGENAFSILKDATGGLYIPLVPAAGDATGPPSPGASTGAYPPVGTGATGAWIGIASPSSGVTNLVLSIQAQGMASPYVLMLASLTTSAVTIPPLPLPGLSACLTALQTKAIGLGAAGTISASGSGTAWTVSLLSQQATGTDPGGFVGAFSLGLAINTSTGAINFVPGIPAFSVAPNALALPLTAQSVKTAFVNILTWLANLPQVKATPFGKVAGDIAVLAGDAVTGVKADPAPILIDLTTAILPLPKNTPGSPVTFTATTATVKGQSDTILKASVNVGPIDAGSSSLPVHIGTLGAAVGVNLGSDITGATPPPARFYSFTFSFSDLRLGDQSSGGASLIGSLLPDLNKVKGFNLSVAWTSPNSVEISGGGTISIQQTLGPFDIGSLTVSVKNNTTIKIGVDLTFSLGPITVSTQDLGFQLGLGSGPSLPPFLQGLGLSMDTSFINLTGLFGSSGAGDYIGGASVSVADTFQLSAIGGYTKVAGSPSLFIFASLVAPLGGTPWMFITGVAGGFGLNRKLPPVLPIDKHPFLRVMSGDLKLTGGVAAQLQQLAQEFGPQKGEFWVAGGIQFISFGLIHGKVIVAVAFGHDFSLQLIGAASFSISPVAYFEIDIAVTVDAEKFLMVASLNPNSYVIDPGLLSLQGDFALGVWYSGAHAGDFLLSIGGYHPYYTKPDYYPTLNRVGVKAHIDLGITINISVEGFFALTTQALMAGASASISASIAGISAGLDVYVDVFIQWDPFFILADLGVTVWFVFFGRHEIGVDLSIHTPPFGGTATIHLFIVSFSFSFGSSILKPKGPSITQFVVKNLQAAAVEKSGSANVPAFNTASSKGLLKLAITQGRAAADAVGTSSAQEGTNSKQPILVNAILFTVTVTTLLPFETTGKTETAGKLVVSGTTDLALCSASTDYSQLTLTWSANPTSVATPYATTQQAWFPVAQFGKALDPIQGNGARQNVAKATSGPHSIQLTNVVELEYYGAASPAKPPAYNESKIQESEGSEIFPLPLKAASTRRPVLQLASSTLKFSAAAPTVSATRRATSVAPAKAVVDPIGVSSLAATWARPVAAGVKHTSVKVPAGATVIPAPASPARRDELSAISLRIVPARTTAPKAMSIRKPVFAPLELRQILTPTALTPSALTPAAGVAGSTSNSIAVPNGQSVHTAITGGLVVSGTLTAGGNQALRMILLGYGETFKSDGPVANGANTLPRGLRSVFLIANDAPAPTAPIGAETHCTLLALGRRIFAGLGCVIVSNIPLPATYHPLDSVPAADVLPNLVNAKIHFGAPASTATLVLTFRQSAGAGDAAENVRWRSLTATLGALTMITGAGSLAFVMPVAATGPWSLELDLGVGWSLQGAAIAPQAAADVVTALRNSTNWNMVDDRFQGNPNAGSNTVTLEVQQ